MRSDPVALGGLDAGGLDRCGELGHGHVMSIRLEDPGVGLHDLAQGPERDPFAIGQAPALTPEHDLRTIIDEGMELPNQPALAHARLAGDRDQLDARLLEGPLEDVLEQA